MSEMSAEDLAMRAALKAQFASSARRKKSSSVQGRKDLEKRAMLKPDDGRVSNRGETVQLNVEIEREWKTWLAQAKRDHKLPIVKIIERGLALVRAELEGERNG